jgi:hypothetical protein
MMSQAQDGAQGSEPEPAGGLSTRDPTYLEPQVVSELPNATSALDYVIAADSHTDSPDRVAAATGLAPLMAGFEFFLGSADPTLVVLGDAGSGKSLFCNRVLQHLLPSPSNATQWGTLDTPLALLRGPPQGPSRSTPCTPWLPLHIELKQHGVRGLRGLVARLLAGCGWPAAALPVPPLACPRVRLLVLCDGYDELQREHGDPGAVHGFVTALCAGVVGEDWDPGQLKVVVTTRESALGDRVEENMVFGRHQRMVLLPFDTGRVSRRVGE